MKLAGILGIVLFLLGIALVITGTVFIDMNPDTPKDWTPYVWGGIGSLMLSLLLVFYERAHEITKYFTVHIDEVEVTRPPVYAVRPATPTLVVTV